MDDQLAISSDVAPVPPARILSAWAENSHTSRINPRRRRQRRPTAPPKPPTGYGWPRTQR